MLASKQFVDVHGGHRWHAGLRGPGDTAADAKQRSGLAASLQHLGCSTCNDPPLHLVHVRQHRIEESRERLFGDLHTATITTRELIWRGPEQLAPSDRALLTQLTGFCST